MQCGKLSLDLDPVTGICRRLRWKDGPAASPIDLLAWSAPSARENPFEVGSFALVPYSNRLFEGRLLTPDGSLTVPCNAAGIDTPVHGLGWRTPWRMGHAEPKKLSVHYEHAADAHWPFTHACEQLLALSDGAVRLSLRLINLGDRPMPAGLGFHPWFALTEGSRLRFEAATVWMQDARGRPTLAVSPKQDERFDFSQWRSAQTVEQNHCHSGWSGQAELLLPQHGLALTLSASPSLGHLMVYRKPGQPWLCLEPVSHATGAWSLDHMHSSEAGAHMLAPGEALEAWMQIAVRALPRPVPGA